MPDPILVEERFQALVEELETVESIRQRISLIRDFFLFLEGNYAKFESYIVELIHFWPLYSGPITYSGINPAEIIHDLRFLEGIASQAAAVAHQEKFSEITVRLREVAVIQFVCLGEVKSALNMLDNRKEKGWDDQLEFENDPGTERSNIHTVHDFRKLLLLEYSSKSQKELLVNIDRIVGDLDYILSKQNQNDTLVPVVENFESLDGINRSYGRLRRLKVRVNDASDQQNDRIVRRFNVVGVEKPSWLEDSRVSLAARALIDRFSQGIEIKHYNGEIYYEYSGAMHQGHSSNAATAALWFTGLQKREELRNRYQLSKHIAITGDVDNDGNVLPVSENSIKAKVHAAFYSWATTLIVPAPQADSFREELFILQKKYPHKELTLLAPERLDDLFYDRRVSTHLNPSKIRYIAGRMWHKKFETAGLIVILILSVLVFRLLYGPLDKNPVLYEYSGEVLKILNQQGAQIDELEVGEATITHLERTGVHQLVDFEDVTDNGIREIFWAKSLPNSSGSVFMKEAGKENHIWEHEIGKDLTFPNKPFVFQNKYRPYKVDAGDFNHDGVHDLIVNYAHRNYFPGILSLFNASTGEEISHFVHSGRINDFVVADITGDEKSEVILSGINNAYSRAFLAVLDIEKIDGYGPATDEYLLEEYKNAEMIAYLLFPKTLVARAITQDSAYNRAPSLRYNEEYGIVEVSVNDFVNYTIEEEEQTIGQGRLYVYLNKNLDVNGIGTSDDYDITAEYLFENGIIDRYPDNDYFEEYKQEILYWDGNEFVKRIAE